MRPCSETFPNSLPCESSTERHPGEEKYRQGMYKQSARHESAIEILPQLCTVLPPHN